MPTPAHSRACGEAIGRALAADDLAGIFVLSDGLNVNGSELVAGITGVVGPKIPLTGGLAGDGAMFEETLVGADCAPQSGQVAAIGFYGPAIRIGHGSAGGWDEFGPRRRITRSTGNVLYELDGEPALDLYERYLGEEDARGLPGTALLFPLLIRDPAQPDQDVVRTVLAIDREARSMTFAGDVPEGWVAQLMRGNFDRLAAGAAEAARQARAGLGAARDQDGLAVLVSCIGRRLLMGQRIMDEVEAAGAELGSTIPRRRLLFVRRDFAARRGRRLPAAQPDHDRHRDHRGSLTPVHKLFARQLAKATTPSGEVDLDELGRARRRRPTSRPTATAAAPTARSR